MATRDKMFPSVPRTDFGPAPAGYIAGIGRGAVGFTTRSDIGAAGPMAEERSIANRGRHLPASSLPVAQANLARQAARAQAELEKKQKTAQNIQNATHEEDRIYTDSNYDEFSGFNEKLFANTNYDEDDREADAIYQTIDDHLESRRPNKKRTASESTNANPTADSATTRYTNKKPKIAEQFNDLRQSLATVSEAEWSNIPEALDYSRHNRLVKKFVDRETSVPDSVLLSSLQTNSSTNLDSSIDVANNTSSTPTTTDGTISTDLTQLGKARDKMLSMKLDRIATDGGGTLSAAGTASTVNPQGYLTDLGALKINSSSELSDIKKARLLYKNITTTNPTYAAGWIAAARLEREVGKISTARSIIMEATEHCPRNEDVWIEAVTLHDSQQAKSILTKAVRHLPHSVTLWLTAANMENDAIQRKAVLRRAVELIPQSVKLWKALIALEPPADALILLYSAVELIPSSTDLWLALARLETYDNAKSVLNRARKAIPTDIQIWLAAARLEETVGHLHNVDNIIQKTLIAMAKNNVKVDRDSMLHEAETTVTTYPATATAIVKQCINLGVDELDYRNTLMADIETYKTSKPSIQMARIVYEHGLQLFSTSQALWLAAVGTEREIGDKQHMLVILQRATTAIPQSTLVWLMAAKEVWLTGDVDEARKLLQSAFERKPDSEEIWLAAVKLETETQQIERARILLATARQRASSPRVYMKAAKLERTIGDHQRQHQLLTEGVKLYPADWKLQLMLAQYYTAQKDHSTARETYRAALQQSVITTVASMWIQYARMELEANSNNLTGVGRARSVLEAGRQRLPNSDILWLESVRAEQRASMLQHTITSTSQALSASADAMLSKGLQHCPSSGILWAYSIIYAPQVKRKAKTFEALKRCTEDVHVFTAVARLFWHDRKYSKARGWFERAVSIQKDWGDAWAYYLKFEQQQHTLHLQQQTVVKQEANGTGVKTENGTSDHVKAEPAENGHSHTVKAEANDYGVSSPPTSDRIEALLRRVDAAEPAHGELWCAVSKQDRLVSLQPREVVVKVADTINEVMPPT